MKKRRLLQTECHIGIVGGGLAGLSAALAILRAVRRPDSDDAAGRRRRGTTNSDGHDGVGHHDGGDGEDRPSFRGRITIYERDSRPGDRREGYGMTLTYDPYGPLAKLGVLEDVARRDCPSRCHYVFDEWGEVRGYFGNAFYASRDDGGGEGDGRDANNIVGRGAGQRGNLRIPRSELRSVLANALMSEAGRLSVAGDERDGSSRSSVQILWNKRLLSYVDRPMMEKLNQTHHGKKNGRKNGPTLGGVESQPTEEQGKQRPVILHFEDGTTDHVDLLVGADGVNSVVAKQYLSTPTSTRPPASSLTSTTTSQPQHDQPPGVSELAPRSVGIFIMLGISDHFHPLIDERGFHTLDGNQRLFIMPFQGSRLDDDVAPASACGKSRSYRNPRRRSMWQLSFPISDEGEAVRLSRLSPKGMQAEVLRRCGRWHAPVPDLVKETPLETIWGTSLLDRDPRAFLEHRAALEIHGRLPSRVVLLGDAAHPMTPFKGQGANQALADGPLLAKWLSQSKLPSAVRGFMTEMAHRSGVKVRASREAATRLHSRDCWEWMFQQEKHPANGSGAVAVFHGVRADRVDALLRTLNERDVGASRGSKLDETIFGIIRELGIAETTSSTNSGPNRIPSHEMVHFQSQALEFSSLGSMSQLRQLSRKSHLIIPNARDAHGRTCLHLAAHHGHVHVCRWLLSEVNIPCTVLDAHGNSPMDSASRAGNKEIVQLLTRWMNQMEQPCENDNGIHNMRNPAKALHTSTNNSSSGQSNGELKDVYHHVERQLRGIRTEKELLALLQKNRNNPKTAHDITRVIGCDLDQSDKEQDRQQMKLLADEHGAVLLPNFVSREVDQLALGALALRPMNFDISGALHKIRNGAKDIRIGANESISKGEKKRASKCIEEAKSQLMIPADADIIVQTNFGPQMQSYSANSGQSNSESTKNAQKKRKFDSFPLSRLRYINLGQWNYNWGDRRYEMVQNASVLPDRMISLAQRAHGIATGQVSPVPFDMAICNLYHLQRPSDRLGGHQDNVESNLSLPLVTFSLGASGIFLLGRGSRNEAPTAILLRAGDCMVLSGRSRGYFHGIPTILQECNGCSHAATDLPNECVVFPELNDHGAPHKTGCENDNFSGGTSDVPSFDEMTFVKAFLSTVRMNLSIRQV